jgi:hypothetical protein
MPFGIRDPYAYTNKDRRVIYPKNRNVCEICSRDLSAKNSENWTAVAPVKIPFVDTGDIFESITVLGCQSCYVSQQRMNFHTLDALTDYRKTAKVGRKLGTAKIDEHDKGVPVTKPSVRGRPRKNPFDSVSITNEHVTIDLHSLQSLYKQVESLYESLGKLINSTKNIAPEDVVLGAPVQVADDDDDIEAGMTDEQRAKMAEAVKIAADRAGKVPQESPNGW